MYKLNKLVDDTLKEKNGKWSRKSLTLFVFTIMSVLTGSYIVFSHLLTDVPISETSEVVFLGFMAGSGVMVHYTVKDKKENKDYHNEKEVIG